MSTRDRSSSTTTRDVLGGLLDATRGTAIDTLDKAELRGLAAALHSALGSLEFLIADDERRAFKAGHAEATVIAERQRSADDEAQATTVRYELERELRQATTTTALLRGVLAIMGSIDKLTANVERLERLATTVLNRAADADGQARREAGEKDAAVDALADRVWAAGDKLEAALPKADTPPAADPPVIGVVETPSAPESPPA